ARNELWNHQQKVRSSAPAPRGAEEPYRGGLRDAPPLPDSRKRGADLSSLGRRRELVDLSPVPESKTRGAEPSTGRRRGLRDASPLPDSRAQGDAHERRRRRREDDEWEDQAARSSRRPEDGGDFCWRERRAEKRLVAVLKPGPKVERSTEDRRREARSRSGAPDRRRAARSRSGAQDRRRPEREERRDRREADRPPRGSRSRSRGQRRQERPRPPAAGGGDEGEDGGVQCYVDEFRGTYKAVAGIGTTSVKGPPRRSREQAEADVALLRPARLQGFGTLRAIRDALFTMQPGFTPSEAE
ncbi:unnamed protein product, partial [Prorocentrum cordatum]